MKEIQDYTAAIISIIGRFRNKALLKMVYNLAEYLYIYKDGGRRA